jgi:hypothetical protein
MKNKKAQGISLETIVIAIIVIVVLLVLILVFTGRINVFGIGLKNCEGSLAGDCSASPCGTEGKATLQSVSPEGEGGRKQGCTQGEVFCCSKVGSDA